MKPPPAWYTGWRRRLYDKDGRRQTFRAAGWEPFLSARTRVALMVAFGELELRSDHSNWEYAMTSERQRPPDAGQFGKWGRS